MRRKTIEDYVEVIYNLQKKKDRVHTNDIASAFDISAASVTEVFQKLHEEGYIDYKKYSGVNLTKKGKKLAVLTKNKHNVLKDFLLLLGVDEDIAETDACEMEHILHEETMKMITKFIEVIETCEVTPFWLKRFKKFVETGELMDCPKDLIEITKKLSMEKD